MILVQQVPSPQRAGNVLEETEMYGAVCCHGGTLEGHGVGL